MQSDELQAALLQGRASLQRGEIGPAESRYRQALALDPSNAEALRSVAAICINARRFQEAAGLIESVVAADPRNADAWAMLGSAHEGMGDIERAVADFERGLALRRDSVDLRRALAAVLYRKGDHVRAEAQARIVFDRAPDMQGAALDLAICLQALNRHEEAIAILTGALSGRPDSAELLDRLARSFTVLERFAEAASARERVLALDPNNVNVIHDLAATYGLLGRFAEAIPLHERAVALLPDNPTVHFTLWNILLRSGDFGAGWPAYERWMRVAGHNRGFPKPRWEGEPRPEGALLVYTDHGIGDALLMLRYLPAVKERFQGRLIVEVRPELAGLVRNDPAVDLVVEQHPDRRPPAVRYDAVIGFFDLPGALGVELTDLPLRSPSVRAPQDRVEHWKHRLAGADGLRVGICWTGSSANDWNEKRTCPPGELARLAAVPGVSLFSLQKGIGAEQAAEIADSLGMTDLGPELTDFTETAAAIVNLDLVVSIETSVAHLAGALGSPVWTLLAGNTAWIWFTEREDSPWYPSMRLYRQAAGQGWADVVDRVTSDMSRLAGAEDGDEASVKRSGQARAVVGMARTYLQRGKLDIAEDCFRRALALEPRNADALKSAAVICLDRRRFGQAARFARRLTVVQPDNADAWGILGAAYEGERSFGRALASCERGVEADPDNVGLRRAYAVALFKTGDFVRAESEARAVLDRNPDGADDAVNLAFCLQALDRQEEAIFYLKAALLSQPHNAYWLERLAASYLALERYEEAIAAYERILAEQPEDGGVVPELTTVYAVHNIASAYGTLGRLDEARPLHERAVELRPDLPTFHYTLWNLLLRSGDFRAGWPAYERWMQVSRFKSREFPKPVWRGEAQPRGSLLVYADHGYGDALLMLRLLAAAKERFQGRLIVEVRPEMAGLVRSDPAVDLVVEQHLDRRPPPVPYDAVIGFMSLAGLQGIALEDLPLRAPSAWAPADRVDRWKRRLAGYDGLRVGICWTGDSTNEWNVRRSVPLLEFAPLARIPGVRLFSLQKGFGANHAAALADEVPLVDLGPELTDFAETAAAIGGLDLVVTMDTAVAHLAGALGAPVWTLLAKITAWMWLTEREDSPWYPSMRLYRQSVDWDWSDPMARVAADLARLANAHASGRERPDNPSSHCDPSSHY